MGYFGSLGAFGGANPADATAGQIAEKAAVEGLVGGTLSAVAEGGRGGSFESGFLGAFAAALIGGGIEPNSTSGEAIALRTALAAVAGGTAAEIGGGSFANGAVSAAFQELFNDAMTAERREVAYKRMMAKYGSVIGYGNVNVNALVAEAKVITHGQFVNKVRTNGKWDFKDLAIFAHFKNRVLLDQFGNFMFGVLARANGFTLGEAVIGAGTYQTIKQGYASDGAALVGRGNFAYSVGLNGVLGGALFSFFNPVARFEINYMDVRFGDNVGEPSIIEKGYDYYGTVYGSN